MRRVRKSCQKEAADVADAVLMQIAGVKLASIRDFFSHKMLTGKFYPQLKKIQFTTCKSDKPSEFASDALGMQVLKLFRHAQLGSNR
jgi:hypothetical protein